MQSTVMDWNGLSRTPSAPGEATKSSSAQIVTKSQGADLPVRLLEEGRVGLFRLWSD